MTSYSEPADAAAVAAALIERVDRATARLLETAAGLSDEQVREPSLLPGWSRGHVLTHLARNADSLRNLLIWARTGVETPQYASRAARDEAIAAGSGRSASELLADLQASAQQLVAEAARLSPANWTAEVRGLGGAAHPGWFTLRRRLSEVEIHHVDLGASYWPADWPDVFAAELLKSVAGDFDDDDVQPAALVSTSSGGEHRIGPPGAPAELTITGPDWLLLAWLVGRSAGDSLTVEPVGPLPPLPAW